MNSVHETRKTPAEPQQDNGPGSQPPASPDAEGEHQDPEHPASETNPAQPEPIDTGSPQTETQDEENSLRIAHQSIPDLHALHRLLL